MARGGAKGDGCVALMMWVRCGGDVVGWIVIGWPSGVVEVVGTIGSLRKSFVIDGNPIL